jgi:hypothetical protein
VESKCLVYTALFDLSRQKIDGRSIAQYLEWLSETAQIFPGLIVFHDGCCDELEALGTEFIKLEKLDLQTFDFLIPLQKLLKDFKPIAANDVTFTLPEYALMQFAKFELANKLLMERNFQSILWVDAGISRFIKNTKSSTNLNNANFLSKLIMGKYQFAFEIDLRRNLTLPTFKVRVPKLGSCRRIISGTSFWMRRDAINPIWSNAQEHIRSMIRDREWDNEQVYLRKFLGKTNYKVALVLQSKSLTGTLARVFLGERRRLFLFFSIVLNKLLKY